MRVEEHGRWTYPHIINLSFLHRSSRANKLIPGHVDIYYIRDYVDLLDDELVMSATYYLHGEPLHDENN